MKRLLGFFFFVMCFGWAVSSQAIEITGIRLSSSGPNSVRFVADLTGDINPKVSRLTHPERLVLDFPNATFTKRVKNQTGTKAGFVGGIRFGTPFKNTSRVVLDLPNYQLTEKHFLLKPQINTGWRFVLDLTKSGGTISATVPENKGLRPFSPIKKKKVIVLDAGHGGQDPGAISRSGHYEKNITLNMAREMRPLLQKAGYQVVLTRDSDIFIPLRNRIKKAHDAKADLFISIHADSARNSSARGLSVYTISERASDAEAAALAERENKADIILGVDLSDVDPMAGNILLDLAKADTMKKSSTYADYIVSEMKRKVALVPQAHRMAGFVVLKSPSVPSVLIELGYLSNRTEDKNLQSKSYRAALAESMVKAVNNYFNTVSE